jgi:hypothetical protein
MSMAQPHPSVLPLRERRLRWLSRFLLIAGLGNVLVHPVLPWFMPQLFFWTPRNTPYEFMIGGLYIALGIVMVVASRNPLEHKLFIDFVVLGNLLHASVMVYFAIADRAVAHLYGDVLWIGALALLPLAIYPWGIDRFLRGAGDVSTMAVER